jgi:hypothetical protein
MTNQAIATNKDMPLVSDKTCNRCGNTYPATREHFQVNRSNKDGFDYLCVTCRRKQREDYAKKIMESDRKVNVKPRSNNGNGRQKVKERSKKLPMIPIGKGGLPLRKSEELFMEFRYTLAYEICDEVAGHINALKEKIAGELRLNKE